MACVVYIVDHPQTAIHARLRERLPRNEGKIFSFYPAVEISMPLGSSAQAAFFSPRLPASGLTNLEVEIVAGLPAAEFFMNPSGP